MSDTTRDLLIRGIAAAKCGDYSEAQRYLNWMMRYEPSMEEKKEAWYWLSESTDDPAEKRSYLEEILSYDLWDARARRQLAILDGKLKEADIINPDTIRNEITSQPEKTQAHRFTCPSCGGRMTYTPDGQSLTCEYCDSRQTLAVKTRAIEGAPEQDFILGLATAKGHLEAATIREITCKGCGATFAMPPQNMSQICPYCQSAYILDLAASKEVMLPNCLIPFKINADQARLALHAWFTHQSFDERPRVSRGQGVYLPAWCFDLGGTITVRCQIEKRNVWISHVEDRIIQRQNILVLATKRLPEPLLAAMTCYDLDGLVAYDARYLSNWLAETYQISMGDASLNAREIAYNLEKQSIPLSFDFNFRDISFSSANMLVESYQLVLLPVWVTSIIFKDRRSYPLLINGQTGEVVANLPGSGLSSWLDRLITAPK